MKRNYIAYILLTVSLMWSCSEVKDWQDEKDNIPPKSVTDVVVCLLYTSPSPRD